MSLDLRDILIQNSELEHLRHFPKTNCTKDKLIHFLKVLLCNYSHVHQSVRYQKEVNNVNTLKFCINSAPNRYIRVVVLNGLVNSIFQLFDGMMGIHNSTDIRKSNEYSFLFQYLFH